MKCKKCGFENKDTAKFCSRCGQEIETVDVPPKTTSSNNNNSIIIIVALLVVILILAGAIAFFMFNSSNSQAVPASNSDSGSDSSENSSQQTTPTTSPAPKKEWKLIGSYSGSGTGSQSISVPPGQIMIKISAYPIKNYATNHLHVSGPNGEYVGVDWGSTSAVETRSNTITVTTSSTGVKYCDPSVSVLAA